MRLSGISLLGLLAVLVIIALLAVHALSHASPTATSGVGVGYGRAISAAQHSAAQQDAEARRATRGSAPG